MRISDWSSDVCSSDLYAASQHSGQVYRGTAPSDPDGFCALKSASPRPLTACSQPTTAMVLEDRFHRVVLDALARDKLVLPTLPEIALHVRQLDRKSTRLNSSH